MATLAELRQAAQTLAERAGNLTDAQTIVEITKLQITTPEGRPVWYPPDAVLTREEVAAVLAVSVRTVELYPIRCSYPSPTKPRYLFRDVVAFLQSQAA